jgi:hypothetical protein
LKNKTPYPERCPIFIDSSNVSFIQRLKGSIPGEEVDYQRHMEYLRKHKWIKPETEQVDFMNYAQVIPISFAKRGASMLANLYAFLSRGDIAINPKFTTLISALQSAKNLPSSSNNRNAQFLLDKRSQSLDVLDSCRLALFPFDAGTPDFEEEEDDEEEQEEEEEVTA